MPLRLLSERQDKNTNWNAMSKPSTPGHVASTNSNAAKIIHIMTHYASAVSGPHPVHRVVFPYLKLDLIIHMLPSMCPYLSEFLLFLCRNRTLANQNALNIPFRGIQPVSVAPQGNRVTAECKVFIDIRAIKEY